MKIIRSNSNARTRRRGAALLLSLLLLLVLVAIMSQIRIGTMTDDRVMRNDEAMTKMDLAIESSLLQVHETLKADSDAGGAAGGADPAAAGAPGGASKTGAAAGGGAAAAGGDAGAQPCDSRRDEWAMPQRTEINDIKVRILTQDEDSKYNVLNMLNPDEKEAQAAFDRVVRVLDGCREGSRSADIDARRAEEMAKAMRDHMLKRKDSKLPRPKLLTDLEKNEDLGLPLSMHEFMVLAPFEESDFRDFRDEDDKVVHSITSFLTVWSSVGTAANVAQQAAAAAAGTGTTAGASGTKKPATGGDSASKSGSSGSSGSAQSGGTNASGASGTGQTGGGQTGGGANGGTGTGGSGAAGGGASGSGNTSSGGYGVNVNTAPTAVLHALLDSREVDPRFWDKIVEYRNLEDEDETEKDKEKNADEETKEEPQLDEYGNEIIKRKIFESLSELSEVDYYRELPTEIQGKVNQLLTVQSNVFSIYVIARSITSADGDQSALLDPREARKLEDTKGDSLVRVLHSVVWRHKVDDETVITPLVRWELLDYIPYEVIDYPDEDR